ncbi:hypothetical protein [Sediminimonas sp.]|uniref:hypothetical protein n=1 Tax=Sediminimonas sp. TaxID=2823379 RepID=UPI0025D5A8CD|nr:hypothetical protein [Sediminimonas sp.]
MDTSSPARTLREERSAGRQKPALDRETIIREDGSILVRRRHRRRTRMPLQAIGIAIMALFLTKGAVLAHLGPEGHRTRMITMASDNFFHQAQAWVMQEDPVSRLVAAQLRPFLRP